MLPTAAQAPAPSNSTPVARPDPQHVIAEEPTMTFPSWSCRPPLSAGAFSLMLMLTMPLLSANAGQGPATLIATVGQQGIQALGNNVPSAERLARRYIVPK